MIVRGRRVLVGLFRMGMRRFVITLFVVLGGSVMRLRGLLVVLSSFLVCFFRHGKKPPLGVYAPKPKPVE